MTAESDPSCGFRIPSQPTTPPNQLPVFIHVAAHACSLKTAPMQILRKSFTNATCSFRYTLVSRRPPRKKSSPYCDASFVTLTMAAGLGNLADLLGKPRTCWRGNAPPVRTVECRTPVFSGNSNCPYSDTNAVCCCLLFKRKTNDRPYLNIIPWKRWTAASTYLQREECAQFKKNIYGT